MALKKLKPTTPGQRFKVISAFDEITTNKPEKSLVYGVRKSGGRNNQGISLSNKALPISGATPIPDITV